MNQQPDQQQPDSYTVPSNVIYLKRIQRYWYAIMYLEPALRRHFPSNHILTPFTSSTPESVVLNHIQSLNPDKLIMVIA